MTRIYYKVLVENTDTGETKEMKVSERMANMSRDDYEGLSRFMSDTENALKSQLRLLDSTTDQDSIKFHFDLACELEKRLAAVVNEINPEIWANRRTLKQSIREGIGDHRLIQKKCIDMGLV